MSCASCGPAMTCELVCSGLLTAVAWLLPWGALGPGIGGLGMCRRGGRSRAFRPAPCLLSRTLLPSPATLHCRETTDSKLRAFFENFGEYRAFC